MLKWESGDYLHLGKARLTSILPDSGSTMGWNTGNSNTKSWNKHTGQLPSSFRPSSNCSLIHPIKGKQTQEANLPENISTWPHTFSSVLHWTVTKKRIFSFGFELLWSQPCWFTLYQGRAERTWVVMYSILLPHAGIVYNLILQRLLDTKWQHSKLCFCDHRIWFFQKQDKKWNDKHLHVFFFFIHTIRTMHTVHKPMQGMGQTVTARILKTKTPWSLPHWMTLPYLIMSRQWQAKTKVTHSVIGQRQRQVTHQTETTTFTHQTETDKDMWLTRQRQLLTRDRQRQWLTRDKDSHSPDRESWLTWHRHRQVTHQAQTQTGDLPGTKRWLTGQIMTGDSPGSPHRGSCLEWWG